jgi:hypothetical protein
LLPLNEALACIPNEDDGVARPPNRMRSNVEGVWLRSTSTLSFRDACSYDSALHASCGAARYCIRAQSGAQWLP